MNRGCAAQAWKKYISEILYRLNLIHCGFSPVIVIIIGIWIKRLGRNQPLHKQFSRERRHIFTCGSIPIAVTFLLHRLLLLLDNAHNCHESISQSISSDAIGIIRRRSEFDGIVWGHCIK